MGDLDPGSVFHATHRVGDAGLPTYAAPDAASVLEARLDPMLAVRVLEQRPNGWAHVACSNGWTTWVDGRKLLAPGAPGAPAAMVATVARSSASFSMALPLIGCACMVVGAVTPWYEFAGGHLTAWRLPLQFLVARTPGFTEPRVAVLLLPGACIAALGAYQVVAGRSREGRLLMLIGASIATNLATFGLMRWLHPSTGLGLSIGAPLTEGGGVLVMLTLWQTRDRSKDDHGAWGWL